MDQVSEKPNALYLDDLHVGQRFTSDSYHMDENRIKAFAAEFDPQPFHLDEAVAQTSVFNGLSASGWHTASVAMRLLVTGGLPLAKWHYRLGRRAGMAKANATGDTLQVESEIQEILLSRSKPNQGVVKVRSSTLNQHGEPLYVFTAKVLVFKRPSA